MVVHVLYLTVVISVPVCMDLKILLLLYAKQFKTKQNMFLLVGVLSSLDTVRHFDHVSAVKAYRTRMTMI
jgi:hypothetical protein